MSISYPLRLLALLLLFGGVARAQTTGGVRIGTAGTPNASAVLDLSPDAANAPKGLLPPRLTLAQRNAISSPVAGLVVYQTNSVPGLYVYNGIAWVLQADNLGNHTATQNLNLGTNQLVGNGGNQGLSISTTGALATGSSISAGQSLIADALQNNNGTFGEGLRLGGSLSGEGLASKRTSGGNQFGLDFYTSALNRLSITGSGNVGIGTSSPTQLLDVNGNQNLTGTLQLNTTDQDKIYLTSQGAAGSKLGHGAGWGLLSYAGPGTGSQGYQAWLLSGASAYQERMRLNTNGLGLGTSSPSQLLELAGQAAPTVLLHSNGNNLVNGASLQFRENDLTYGWNLRHNSGGSENGSTNDRLVLESANGGAATPVMSWDQGSGNVSVTNDLNVSGNVGLNYHQGYGDITMSGNSRGAFTIECPTGYRLLSGGGGHRDYNSAVSDITVNYTGPDNGDPMHKWLVMATNDSGSSRTIRIWCTCAKVQ
jgi:hypothetical protein